MELGTSEINSKVSLAHRLYYPQAKSVASSFGKRDRETERVKERQKKVIKTTKRPNNTQSDELKCLGSFAPAMP